MSHSDSAGLAARGQFGLILAGGAQRTSSSRCTLRRIPKGPGGASWKAGRSTSAWLCSRESRSGADAAEAACQSADLAAGHGFSCDLTVGPHEQGAMGQLTVRRLSVKSNLQRQWPSRRRAIVSESGRRDRADLTVRRTDRYGMVTLPERARAELRVPDFERTSKR